MGTDDQGIKCQLTLMSVGCLSCFPSLLSQPGLAWCKLEVVGKVDRLRVSEQAGRRRRRRRRSSDRETDRPRHVLLRYGPQVGRRRRGNGREGKREAGKKREHACCLCLSCTAFPSFLCNHRRRRQMGSILEARRGSGQEASPTALAVSNVLGSA